ncbi:MAG: hypothetical protein HY848_21125 [Betaproteobacteria bacterium]|nr:hypothetical protein [Betaproteobacteria bacterium]
METIVISIIVFIFAAFAIAIAWALHYTSTVRTPGATYFDAAKSGK